MWSVIVRAGDSRMGQQALETLCHAYRAPLLVCIRQFVHSGDDTEDLFHDFLQKKVLSGGFFKNLGPSNGKFRSFLVASLRNFLRDELDRRNAEKRRAHGEALRIDAPVDEVGGIGEIAARDEPGLDRQLDRAWAEQVLERALSVLQQESELSGKGALFQAVKARLHQTGREAGGYGALALQLAIDEGSLRVAVHRMRKRIGELIRDEVRQTVTDEAALREELQYLIGLFSI